MSAAPEIERVAEELAVISVALSDLETTLGTLAQGLARHPPGDLEPVRVEIEVLRKQIARGDNKPQQGHWLYRGLMVGLGLWLGTIVFGTAKGTETATEGVTRLFQQVDRVLVLQYNELPHAVRAQLQKVYANAGVASPGERQKK